MKKNIDSCEAFRIDIPLNELLCYNIDCSQNSKAIDCEAFSSIVEEQEKARSRVKQPDLGSVRIFSAP